MRTGLQLCNSPYVCIRRKPLLRRELPWYESLSLTASDASAPCTTIPIGSLAHALPDVAAEHVDIGNGPQAPRSGLFSTAVQTSAMDAGLISAPHITRKTDAQVNYLLPSISWTSSVLATRYLATMCYQLVEVYSSCLCVYYQHAVDRCSRYPDHDITRRTVFVGHACPNHSNSFRGNKGPSYSNTEYHGLQTSASRAGNRSNAGLDSRLDTEGRLGEEETPDTYSLTPKHNESSTGGDFIQAPPLNCTDFLEQGTESDSEASQISETETVLSAATSTTLVGSDAVEAIFRRLLLFNDLRYLWPQLIVRCETRSRFVQATERLLRRYSVDLGSLAQRTVKTADSIYLLSASRFVRK